jgi:hypothetical protein
MWSTRQLSLFVSLRLIPGMAFDALKLRNIPQIYRVFEWFISLVARLTLPIGEHSKIDRVLKWLRLDGARRIS